MSGERRRAAAAAAAAADRKWLHAQGPFRFAAHTRIVQYALQQGGRRPHRAEPNARRVVGGPQPSGPPRSPCMYADDGIGGPGQASGSLVERHFLMPDLLSQTLQLVARCLRSRCPVFRLAPRALRPAPALATTAKPSPRSPPGSATALQPVLAQPSVRCAGPAPPQAVCRPPTVTRARPPAPRPALLPPACAPARKTAWPRADTAPAPSPRRHTAPAHRRPPTSRRPGAAGLLRPLRRPTQPSRSSSSGHEPHGWRSAGGQPEQGRRAGCVAAARHGRRH